MLSVTEFQNLISKKQQELENERLSKLQQKQTELQQLEEELSKVQKYRPFDPQKDWCPFMDAIDDDNSFCMLARRTFEFWCGKIQVKEGKLYCPLLKRFLGDAVKVTKEYSELEARVNGVRKEIEKLSTPVSVSICDMISIIKSSGYIEDGEYTVYRISKSLDILNARLVKFIERSGMYVHLFVDQNDRIIAIEMYEHIGYDDDWTWSYYHPSVDISKLRTMEEIELIRERNYIKQVILDKAKGMKPIINPEKLRKWKGDPEIEQVAKANFGMSVEELALQIEKEVEEEKRRREEEKRKEEEKKKEKEGRIKKAFMNMKFVEVKSDGFKITVRAVRYVDKELFGQFVATAKQLGLKYDYKSKEWYTFLG